MLYALAIAIQQGQGLLHGIQQLLGMCQALVFGIELLPFVCSRGQFVHFGNLPLQTLALLLALGLALTGRFELLLTGAPVLPVLADGVGFDACAAGWQWRECR